MSFFARCGFLLILTALTVSWAQAQLIVERQRGGPMQYTGIYGGAAAYFEIYEPTRVYAVKAWVNASFEMDVTLSLYESGDEGGYFRDVYSASFFPTAVAGAPAKWQGADSLAWDVQPGSYQIAFMEGYFPLAYGGPPSTAPQHPSYYEFFVNGQWEYSGFPFGVQIYGLPLSAVPEPSTFGMIGAALLLGITVIRRTRSRRLALD